MSKILLFSSISCAPCKSLKKYLTDKGVDYTVISDYTESGEADKNFPMLASQYSVRQVPTMIKVTDDKEEISRMVGFGNVSKIDEFVGV